MLVVKEVTEGFSFRAYVRGNSLIVAKRSKCISRLPQELRKLTISLK